MDWHPDVISSNIFNTLVVAFTNGMFIHSKEVQSAVKKIIVPPMVTIVWAASAIDVDNSRMEFLKGREIVPSVFLGNNLFIIILLKIIPTIKPARIWQDQITKPNKGEAKNFIPITVITNIGPALFVKVVNTIASSKVIWPLLYNVAVVLALLG